MESASPPVSPSVVAAILIIQNAKVTCGTLFFTSAMDQVLHLSAREPRMVLPEELQLGIGAAEDVAFGAPHIGHARGERAARTQRAFAVAGVLPQLPRAPRRNVTRFIAVIRDPEPAIRQGAPLRRSHARRVQHLAQAVFAAVKAGVFSGALV